MRLSSYTHCMVKSPGSYIMPPMAAVRDEVAAGSGWSDQSLRSPSKVGGVVVGWQMNVLGEMHSSAAAASETIAAAAMAMMENLGKYMVYE